MLVGTFKRSLDTKLRIMLPSSFRKELGNTVYFVPFNGSLRGYSEQEYRVWVQNLNLKERDRDDDELLVGIANKTTQVDFDKAGRLSLGKIEETDPDLLKELGLSGEVIVAGGYTSFEIRSLARNQELDERRKDGLERLYYESDKKQSAAQTGLTSTDNA